MIDHAADRMTRNATALVASSVISALLGLLFWVVAARVLPTDQVGVGTAVVTSIVLLGNVATLGLRNGLIRFISPAGRVAGRFITATYALCAGVAVVIAAVYAIGTRWWAQELSMLRTDLVTGVAFTAGTAVWTVFVLQDNVLTGLRRAVWVPVENVAYSLLKLGLLVALVGAGAWALPLAWCIPALVVIVPVNTLIFRRLLPEHGDRPADGIFTRSAIARFSLGDFGADVIRMLGAEVVVLVVLGMRGVEDTAYVFFAITIAASGALVANNIVTAFVAEAAARPDDARGLARRAAFNIGRLVVPGAIAGALAAPIVLGVFGSDYADNGTDLLRLLLLDAIPLAVAALATGWARYRRAVGTMVLIAAATAAAPLFGAIVLAPRWGLDAIGWAALVGHALLAVVLGVTTLRPVVLGDSGVVDGVADWLVARRGVVRQRRRGTVVAAVLDELDATRRDQPPLEPRWLVPSDNDTAVVRIEHPTAARVAKVALTEAAAAGLRRHVAALADLRDSASGSAAARLLPEVIESDACAGHHVVIETACPGHRPLAADHRTITSVAVAIAEIHRLTAGPQLADADTVAAFVSQPVEVLTTDRRLWRLGGEIERLHTMLTDALVGRDLVLARTHGDCWIGNAMIAADGAVTGLIDWEDSRSAGIPDTDFAHLWLAAQGRHIGRSAREVLLGRQPTPSWEIDLGVTPWNPSLPIDVVILLAWLDHVSSGLRRASRFSLGRLWLADNVEVVLRDVERFDTAGWFDHAGRVDGEARGTVAHTGEAVPDAR